MKQYLLLFISLLSISLSAEEITVDKAKELANIFYQKNHPQHLSASLQMVYDGETNQSRSSGKAQLCMSSVTYREKDLWLFQEKTQLFLY